MAVQRPSAMDPIAPGQRILALDALRGFAIAGVLIAYLAWSSGQPDTLSPFDQRLEAVMAFFVDNKFYTILSFLFGLGFSLQLGRAAERGASVVPTYLRRLAVLAAFGLIHALLLRNGDILLPYAVVGMALVAFRKAPDWVLLTVAFAALFWDTAAHALWQATGLPIPDRPNDEGLGYFETNLLWVRYWYSTAILNWPGFLTTFLLGFYAGRHRLIQRLAKQPSRAALIAVTGATLGLALHLLRESYLAQLDFSTATTLQKLAAKLLFTGHALALATGYGAAIVFLAQRPAGARLLAPLAQAGRMALTNYLMQAMLVVPICLVFGLFDRMTPSMALALAAGIFLIVQLPFSHWWLKRHDYGPAEWLWRRLTYGHVGGGAAKAPA